MENRRGQGPRPSPPIPGRPATKTDSPVNNSPKPAVDYSVVMLRLPFPRFGPLKVSLALGSLLPCLLAKEPAAAEPDAPLSANPELDVRRDSTVAAVERVMPAVVNIATRTWVDRSPSDSYQRWIDEFYGRQSRTQQVPQISRGSGVVIDPDGYVLTNVHVVKDVNEIYVQFPDSTEGSEPNKGYPAERVTLSEDKDIAILKIRAPAGKRFRAVRLAKADDLLLGETVLALGNPFGLGGSVSRGILSSKSRRPNAVLADGQPLDIPDWLQTDAAINPGNSGGPLINLRGELIGINVAVLAPNAGAQGIGFAIPVKRITEAMAEKLSGESFEGLWFGARLKPELNQLTVTSVQTGSPADKAGLTTGDVIQQVDNQPAGSLIDFNRKLVAVGTERTLKLTVRRDGANRALSLRLQDEAEFFNARLFLAKTGLTLKPDRGAFVVQSVEPSSPAALARIRPGMYVVGFDGNAADDLVAIAKAAYQKPKGETLKLELIYQQGWNRFQGEVPLRVR